MKENDIKNAGKAITITTVLTLLAIYQLVVDIYKFPKLFLPRSFNGISLIPLPDLTQATLSLMTFSFSFIRRSLYPPTFMI